jgi:hypothetical protein
MAGMLVNDALLDTCKYYLVNALGELAQFNSISLSLFSPLRISCEELASPPYSRAI